MANDAGSGSTGHTNVCQDNMCTDQAGSICGPLPYCGNAVCERSMRVLRKRIHRGHEVANDMVNNLLWNDSLSQSRPRESQSLLASASGTTNTQHNAELRSENDMLTNGKC